MRKRLLKLTIAVGLIMALSIPAGAASLHFAHVDTECEFGIVTMHFVNNKTGGADPDTLTIIFNNTTVGPLAPDKVNRNVQHWFVDVKAEAGDGAFILENASTNLDGMLVLSDFECNKKKK